MRTFSEKEKQIIQDLTTYATLGKDLMEDFLKNHYFTKKLNRALVIQAKSRYSVFFLDKSTFQNDKLKDAEINDFFDLFNLIKYLVTEGYIHLSKSPEVLFHFIQDAFDTPKVLNNGTIILNSDGLFSSVPDTIFDKAKTEIYKGLIYRSEEFNLIYEYGIGAITFTDNFYKLLSSPTPSSQKNQKGQAPPEKKSNKTNIDYNPQPQEERNTAANKQELNRTINDTDTPQKSKWYQKKMIKVILICLLSLFVLFEIYRIENLIASTYAMSDQINQIGQRLSPSDSLFSAIKKIHSKLNRITPASEEVLYGIDISKWNGNEVTEIPKQDSLHFIICKATEGTAYIDKEFSLNWDFIRSKSYIIGVYHFYKCNEDPILQAEHFFRTFKTKGDPDISPIVDIEELSLAQQGAQQAASIQNNLLRFLNHLENLVKRRPVIYTDLSFADQYLNNNQLNKYKLWLAEYSDASEPKLPKTWQDSGCFIWQKRDNYYINTHATDYDQFNGSKQSLTQ